MKIDEDGTADVLLVHPASGGAAQRIRCTAAELRGLAAALAHHDQDAAGEPGRLVGRMIARGVELPISERGDVLLIRYTDGLTVQVRAEGGPRWLAPVEFEP